MKKVLILILLLLFCLPAIASVSTITITTASTSLATANADRQSIVIRNTGTTTCYITDEATATTEDMELADGDVYIATGRDAKTAFNGIVSSGTTTVAIWTK